MSPILGVLLAGGQSRRMGGGDKNLRDLNGQSILNRVIESAEKQVDHLIINANGAPERFDEYKLPVVEDSVGGHQGPLAGILTGLEWASNYRPDVEWVMSFATDAPFFPEDLVEQLMNAIKIDQADISCATSKGRSHPVFALWPVRLKDDLHHALTVEEIRKIDRWTSRYHLVEVEFQAEPFDPFFNINRPEDLEKARLFIETDSES
jgi:molybdopterin-guanine dinucleotide biosynthesis protein A